MTWLGPFSSRLLLRAFRNWQISTRSSLFQWSAYYLNSGEW